LDNNYNIPKREIDAYRKCNLPVFTRIDWSSNLLGLPDSTIRDGIAVNEYL
jgi:hypothetical protein